MTRFMIGQYGHFDSSKYQRDFKDWFYGIEACLFATEADAANLLRESKNKSFSIGVHYPFRSGTSTVRDALFLSPDEATREQAFELIQAELEYLTMIQPEYVLFHYPKPVILDDRVNWENVHFPNSAEFLYESQLTIEEFIQKSEYLFQWLTDKAHQYNFIPVLEFDFLNRYIYESNVLENLLVTYPKIKLCLDTARFHIQERIDPFFNSKEILRTYAKYAEVVHLSNAQVRETIQNRHYPVLPELGPNEGWAPIQEYMELIVEENKQVRILFEHRSDLLSDEQLERCYAWVYGIMNKQT